LKNACDTPKRSRRRFLLGPPEGFRRTENSFFRIEELAMVFFSEGIVNHGSPTLVHSLREKSEFVVHAFDDFRKIAPLRFDIKEFDPRQSRSLKDGAELALQISFFNS
jgi:hypothetical protein